MPITKEGKKLLKKMGIDPNAKRKFKMRKWSELFPYGRLIFYEGDDPQGFVEEIKAKFGFDPSKDNSGWDEEGGYSFFCPGDHLDAIYGVSKYPMGS